ncbi:Hypothetical Protein FCC1311_044412 [Hondaea fermentalgiana]|uniref:Uncharacterized protein n=1 Tax=Hondaea fermentalgiana TaxID=2315210 RepID=A0A2R5GEP6_9STRA|nr:Hypothetical Protein FCC1311_044412 [Hondaea fermentalgiana]|eukprot:GBG28218.1 Hypothetical Protein FCC1311_044412 [Hondaea fermentalgiana]
MIITINIGFGFVIGTVLTIVFLVSWLRSVINRDKMEKWANEAEAMLVRSAGRFTVSMLEVPEVHDTLTNLIAGGINAWLVNPEAQARIERLISGGSEKEVARELGKKLPALASSFTRGVLDGCVPFRKAATPVVVATPVIMPPEPTPEKLAKKVASQVASDLATPSAQ